ncbi:hypothetical protein BGZ95_001491 [Linnemannia exigua]|uniref:Uncharacterized protein n=1 Tax=Linnemannia exigua TaxID=604196 RepID=A0AAD4HAU4_9FUNG|nr:hypothetical protein BGZ95_001491 [Linnemannia exigua]
MSTMMERYKALPQKTKNYMQLGALVALAGGIYYRDTIKDKLYPTDRTALDSAKTKAKEMRQDISQAAK